MSKIDKLIQEFCPKGVERLEISKICKTISTGKQRNRDTLSKVRTPEMQYPVINGGISPSGYTDEFNTKEDTITISQGGASAGFVSFIQEPFWSGAHCYTVEPDDTEIILNRFLYFFLKDSEKILMDRAMGAGIPGLNRKALNSLKIPIPPLEVQKEIVNILDKFTQLEAELSAELDARRKQYEYYRNQLLRFDESGSDVKWLTLDKIATNRDSKRKPVTKDARTSGEIPYYGASGIVDYVQDYIFDGDYLLVSEDGANLLARSTPIAFSISGKTWVNNHAHVLEFSEYATRRLVEIYLNSIDLRPYVTGGAQPKLNKANLNKIKIPIPPLDDQKRIVNILDKFDKLVTSISEGLPAEIEARRKQYEYYRTKLLTFQELSV